MFGLRFFYALETAQPGRNGEIKKYGCTFQGCAPHMSCHYIYAVVSFEAVLQYIILNDFE